MVASEQNRRKERLVPHYQNNVWKKRAKPPEDWDKPLPEYIQKEYENSYLNAKAKEMRGEIPPSFDIDSRLSCTIM